MSYLHRLRLSWRAWGRARSLRALRHTNTGAGSKLARSVQVYGWESVRIGCNSMICDDSLLNAINSPPAEAKILIGDCCLIGRRNFLNAGTKLVFADFCLTGTDCHFLGADHAHDTPFIPYLAAGNAADGEIVLGPNVWLGARVTILKNVRIGHGSIVGAASLVTADIPPFAMAVGSPARVLKRFCPRRNAWVAAAEFSTTDEQGLPKEGEYLEKLRQTSGRIRMPHPALGREYGDC